MNDSQLRALIGVQLRATDALALIEAAKVGGALATQSLGTPDAYMDLAQQWLESSYKNYQPPTGGDQQEVDRALSLLTTKGYYITSPGDASTPPPLPVVSEQPPST